MGELSNSKTGEPWSDLDARILLYRVRHGHCIARIAESLGRTQTEVRIKARELGWIGTPAGWQDEHLNG